MTYKFIINTSIPTKGQETHRNWNSSEKMY